MNSPLCSAMNGPQRTACLAKGYINSELAHSELENMHGENYVQQQMTSCYQNPPVTEVYGAADDELSSKVQ